MWAYTTKMTLEGHSNCFVSSKLTTYRATKQTIVHSNICVHTKLVQNPKHDKTANEGRQKLASRDFLKSIFTFQTENRLLWCRKTGASRAQERWWRTTTILKWRLGDFFYRLKVFISPNWKLSPKTPKIRTKCHPTYYRNPLIGNYPTYCRNPFILSSELL